MSLHIHINSIIRFYIMIKVCRVNLCSSFFVHSRCLWPGVMVLFDPFPVQSVEQMAALPDSDSGGDFLLLKGSFPLMDAQDVELNWKWDFIGFIGFLTLAAFYVLSLYNFEPICILKNLISLDYNWKTVHWKDLVHGWIVMHCIIKLPCYRCGPTLVGITVPNFQKWSPCECLTLKNNTISV